MKSSFLPQPYAHNLATIAIGLLTQSPPPEFNMESWAKRRGFGLTPHQVQSDYNECGTSCCFAGHGPIFLKNAKPKDTWANYIEEHLVPLSQKYNTHQLFSFLFDANWPNNRKKAAARTLYALEADTSNDDFQFPSPFRRWNNPFDDLSEKNLVEMLKKFTKPAKPPAYVASDRYYLA